MRLNVLSSDSEPWFAGGLEFTCTQCGNCCTGAPGYVWISDREVSRLAKYLNLPRKVVIEKYCRTIGTRLSLKEIRTPQGLYDCIFLKEIESKSADGMPIVRRVCSVYAARPLQCRTWPFWSGNLASRENWDAAAQRCHGMNRKPRSFTRRQIESLRDARDWPNNPPGST